MKALIQYFFFASLFLAIESSLRLPAIAQTPNLEAYQIDSNEAHCE